MNIFKKIWRRIKMFFADNGTTVEKAFGVTLITSNEMNTAIKQWDNISIGKPSWQNAEDGIATVNMAKHICDTRAKLCALDIGISVSGSRADYLQGVADSLLARLPDALADAYRLGGMMLKWSGSSWDYLKPGDFGVTDVSPDGDIRGAIFAETEKYGGTYYTRLEYHRFEGETDGAKMYRITNKAFRNRMNGGEHALGEEVTLERVPKWANIQPDVTIGNLDEPLFAYFRVPGANHIDEDSPFGVAAFANAIPQLKAIDIAISRKDMEIEDSKHITFVGQALIKSAANKGLVLPRFVQGLGTGLNDNDTSAIHEHTPTLLTDQRIKDINFDLSMAGVLCGFSEGVFVMDGQTGMITATQVEADDRDTIQTVKTDRDALKHTVQQAMASADAIATLMNLCPLGGYELTFNFGNITYNYEEDKAAWKSYAQQGWIPKWLYFTKFEGMSEDEAKAICGEAEQANKSKGLFGIE